ncbi:MAG: type II toxin-antitoxin system PemK/MazF family toxin [Anaerolineales bacterium]
MARGDIVLVDLPRPASGSGHEQIGSRPALVVHDDASSGILSVAMIIPFTSKRGAQRFPHTILIQPPSVNGLRAPSILLVFQLRAIDRRRITRTIGHLEADTMELVNEEMKRLLGL